MIILSVICSENMSTYNKSRALFHKQSSQRSLRSTEGSAMMDLRLIKWRHSVGWLIHIKAVLYVRDVTVDHVTHEDLEEFNPELDPAPSIGRESCSDSKRRICYARSIIYHINSLHILVKIWVKAWEER